MIKWRKRTPTGLEKIRTWERRSVHKVESISEDSIKQNIGWQGVYTWFHTYGRTRESSEKFKGIKKWTGRRVLAVQAKEELKKTIQGKTGGWVEATSGRLDNQKAFGTYQKELSNLWDKTSEVEKRKMEDLADIWNRMGPPAEEQARYDLRIELMYYWY
jgi:hypothetical protein